MSAILLVLPLVVLFFMMRQQQKRAREQQALINSVEVGDDVVTVSGIFATVTAIYQDKAVLEIAPGVEVTVLKRAISGYASFDEAADEEDDEDEVEHRGELEEPDAGPHDVDVREAEVERRHDSGSGPMRDAS